MKLLIAFIFVSAFFFSSTNVDAQSGADTIQANKLRVLGEKYFYAQSPDSSIWYFQKAVIVYKNIIKAKEDTLIIKDYLSCLNDLSIVYSTYKKFDKSKETLDSSLVISLKLFGKDHMQTAMVYSGYVNHYRKIPDLNLAQEYNFKQLDIYKKIYSENSESLGELYTYIGENYYS